MSILSLLNSLAMRSPLGLGVVLAIWLAVPCNAYTYYVDQSCYLKPEFQAYLNEATYMAGRASARLASATDTDFEAVFTRIFKVDKTDAEAVQEVHSKFNSMFIVHKIVVLMSRIGILGGIPTWTQTLNRGPSDIRFHCDNGRR
jgi:hypothetical protein